MIEAHDLTKRYGGKLAVAGLTFTVQPGVVTGFLGPNGAGKSTTIRMILGLDKPTAGTVTVNGHHFAGQAAPLREAGALLEAKAVHPGRTARNHLLALAATTGISRRRVDEVVDLVGLSEVADKRAGGFSLGMGQRLGIAAALLRSPQATQLRDLLGGPGVSVTSVETGVLDIDGADSEEVGRIAHDRGIVIYELTPRTTTLEDAFLELTRDDVEYRADARSQ
ncbi:MAG: ATP-binding cassette domain-containing protein [Streptosporangiaceae bacterium]|jgi:ABC-2 type transport system ATP-binding protein